MLVLLMFLKDKTLWIDGHEVGVIYLRCGYHPDQYPSEKEWEARLMMERSVAIKSPSIHYHLAGTKKVQQELAKPGMVEKFLGDKDQIESVRDIFTGLYSLDHVSTKQLKNLDENPGLFLSSKGGGTLSSNKDYEKL